MRSMDDFAKQVYQQPGGVHVRVPQTGYEQPELGGSSGTWWWAFGQTEKGKRALLGPFSSETEAHERADKLDDMELFQLDTRNQARATQEIKAILLKRGSTADDALTRQLHEKGLQREGKK